MLSLKVNEQEFWDEDREEFVYVPELILELEHSLLSISKWETKYKRPFLSETKGPKTQEEIVDYVRFMTLNENVNPTIYNSLTEEQFNQIFEYIQDPATATTFKKKPRKAVSSYITSEIIYWEMSQFGIPFECEKWNLNRLLTLLRVCDEKGQPPKKMGQDALLRQYAGVNAKRRPRKH